MVAEAQEKTVETDAPVSEGLQKIITAIEKLSVLELADLVKALEKKFGVSAQAPMAMAMPMAGAAGAAAPKEEKTEFDAVLTMVGDKKIQVIKVVRELTGLGLKESKDLVDGAPKPIKTGIPQAEADTIKAKLAEVGATVEIK
jgi:large subunit ribosomal protein L7/L12